MSSLEPTPDAVDTRPVQLSALRALPADEPVVMINLLKFNQAAVASATCATRRRWLRTCRGWAPTCATAARPR